MPCTCMPKQEAHHQLKSPTVEQHSIDFLWSWFLYLGLPLMVLCISKIKDQTKDWNITMVVANLLYWHSLQWSTKREAENSEFHYDKSWSKLRPTSIMSPHKQLRLKNLKVWLPQEKQTPEILDPKIHLPNRDKRGQKQHVGTSDFPGNRAIWITSDVQKAASQTHPSDIAVVDFQLVKQCPHILLDGIRLHNSRREGNWSCDIVTNPMTHVFPWLLRCRGWSDLHLCPQKKWKKTQKQQDSKRDQTVSRRKAGEKNKLAYSCGLTMAAYKEWSEL